ncbi:hypothetical protein [Legionella sp. W05-934-2]|uniref:hypothetical protein n=1 Tax=Legionella sp. W05-934-2 TaxID=1198649 RepID=UPI0034634E3F
MDFVMNTEELEALYGLPHTQQLAYLRGIRPYMDVKTGITGIKRGISFQSIAEQLYIEPHQGIKSESYSRAQVRRGIEGLERVGLIQNQSKDQKLILKCLLASRDYSVQNKVITNPSQLAGTDEMVNRVENKGLQDSYTQKADTADTPKAVTPLKEENYIYLLRRFEHFWRMYPEKKSRERALECFKQINPDDFLLRTMLQALENQMNARGAKQAHGVWVPPWKYPANWLAQKCWEDEVNTEVMQEKKHAKDRRSTGRKAPTSGFYIPDENEEFEERGKVIELSKHKKAQGD